MSKVATKAEAKVDAKREAMLVTMREQVSPLAGPLYRVCAIAGVSGKIEKSWSATVLSLVRWAIETVDISLAEIYSLLEQVLPGEVAEEARGASESAENIGAIVKTAQNKVSQCHQPFLNVAISCSTSDGMTAMLAVLQNEDATWGKVRTYAKGIVEGLAFHTSREGHMVHYTPSGEKVVSFTVGKAGEHRDKLAKVEAQADAISEEWGGNIRAVVKDYREGRMADVGMVDARTTAERDKKDARVGRAFTARFTSDELAELLK